jgi:hypothetical protein
VLLLLQTKLCVRAIAASHHNTLACQYLNGLSRTATSCSLTFTYTTTYVLYTLYTVNAQQLDSLLVAGGCQDAATAQQLQAVLARFVHFTRALNDSALHAVVQSLAALSMGTLTQVRTLHL